MHSLECVCIALAFLSFVLQQHDQRGVAELLFDCGALIDKGCGNDGDAPLFAAAEVS